MRIRSVLQRLGRKGEILWDLKQRLWQVVGKGLESRRKREISSSYVAGTVGGREVPNFAGSSQRTRMKVIVMHGIVQRKLAAAQPALLTSQPALEVALPQALIRVNPVPLVLDLLVAGAHNPPRSCRFLTPRPRAKYAAPLCFRSGVPCTPGRTRYFSNTLLVQFMPLPLTEQNLLPTLYVEFSGPRLLGGAEIRI